HGRAAAASSGRAAGPVVAEPRPRLPHGGRGAARLPGPQTPLIASCSSWGGERHGSREASSSPRGGLFVELMWLLPPRGRAMMLESAYRPKTAEDRTDHKCHKRLPARSASS